MNTSRNLKHLAAGTAAAAVLAAGAGTAALTTTTTTAAGPAGTVLRTLRDDALTTVTGGVLSPAAHPVPRTHILAGNYRNIVG